MQRRVAGHAASVSACPAGPSLLRPLAPLCAACVRTTVVPCAPALCREGRRQLTCAVCSCTSTARPLLVCKQQQTIHAKQTANAEVMDKTKQKKTQKEREKTGTKFVRCVYILHEEEAFFMVVVGGSTL